ncbi:MAG: hypothetical protein PHY48_08340 [Candidatus Cloacimonetes bacterium]|nr:hypothetical protein [Candidatus Cloacimonadota bacterium]
MFAVIVKDFIQSIDNLRDFSHHLSRYLIDSYNYEQEVSQLEIDYNTTYIKIKTDSLLREVEVEKLECNLVRIEDRIKTLCGEDAYFRKFPLSPPTKPRSFNQRAVLLFVKGRWYFPTYGECDSKSFLDHCNTIYKSTFINLITTVEFYITKLFHAHYNKYPEAAELSKKTLTYEELNDMGSIEAATKYLIDHKIDKILKDGTEAWIGEFENKIKLELKYVKPVLYKVTELFQRRNLLVHNMGIIDARYWGKVDKCFKERMNKGDTLSIDEEYLNDSINLLNETFISIAVELWLKDIVNEDGRMIVLNKLIDSFMRDERFSIVEELSKLILLDKNVSQYEKNLALLNKLWSIKEQGDVLVIQKELQGLDFTEDDIKLQVYLLAIKDDFDGISNILEIGIIDKKIEINEIMEIHFLSEYIYSEHFRILLNKVIPD